MCVELNNLYNWMEKDGTYDPELLESGTRIYDPDNPPDDLIYTDCFNIYIEMSLSEDADADDDYSAILSSETITS